MIVRSEESKRGVTYRIHHDGHDVMVTLSANCQTTGSSEAVTALFELLRTTLEKAYGASE